jgi:FkbM family methyltransferase
VIQQVAAPDPPQIAKIMDGFTGCLAFDVGGNVGQSLRVFASRFDHVVSFEPADESFGLLAKAAEKFPNATAVQTAVTGMDGPVTLTVQDAHIAKGQLTSANADGQDWGKILDRRTVPGATLDTLAERHGTPDFIKVDVEGHDALVVLGGLRTIIERKPQLFIEVHNADLGWRIRQMIGNAYGDRLRAVRHPHYPPGSWGESNHFWLVAT